MKYKNIQTGAIVDSPNIIKGKFWKLIDEKQPDNNLEESDVEETEKDINVEEESEEEFVEEEVDLQEMTNKELEELAEKEGIELSTADKKNKDTRIAAIAKAFE